MVGGANASKHKMHTHAHIHGERLRQNSEIRERH